MLKKETPHSAYLKKFAYYGRDFDDYVQITHHGELKKFSCGYVAMIIALNM